MPAGRSLKKAKREDKDVAIAETKWYKKKDSHSFKKRLSTLNFFSGHSRNVTSPERNLLFEDKKRGLQRKEPKKLKAPKQEICSSKKDHSGKMCPKCELIICRMCNVLHTESSFIAHSLLDHYDQGRHSSCCSESGFSQDHHVCKQNPRASLMSRLATTQY